MAFVAQNFGVTPSEAQFRALLKSDLLKLAKHFNLEVRTNLRKAELQATVIQSMVGLGKWDELAWEWLPEEPEDVELRKLELQLRSQERIKEEERKAEKERAEEERKAEKERAEEERKAEKERAEEERKAEKERAEEERKAEKERAEEERKAEKERAEEERKAEERREEKQAEERRVERELQERMKTEERKAEAEERKAERELKERDMELQQEIKFKELELMRERGEAPPLLTGSTPNQKTWDVGRHVRLVPPFSEKEVAKFFPHFEKVARQLNWPEEAWTILVQSVLVGNSRCGERPYMAAASR
uniref:caldesmon-like n=1 Tax=Myxine glutinosa TaxID=7769 RepID=UPI00358F85E6